ncbi:MAG: SPFH domain-containing protein [Pseudomonadota bacterium]
MFGIKYYKADPSTYVVKSVDGSVRDQGRGLSFFFNEATTSIIAVPTNVQEAPFIFSLQTSDFQEVRVQGQITYRIEDPLKTMEHINFALNRDTESYVSDDPMKMPDRIIQVAQGIAQQRIQTLRLKQALPIAVDLATEMQSEMAGDEMVSAMGIEITKTFVGAITPTPETRQALEAESREAILKEADDAIYARRKASVEQERTIREAELETEHEIQQKTQEMEESKIRNERELLRGRAQTETEKVMARIEQESQRSELVALAAENGRREADTEAYAVASKMKALTELPVENLKAIALAKMTPDQLMAVAFESLAENANKIGELNVTPDLFTRQLKKAVK